MSAQQDQRLSLGSICDDGTASLELRPELSLEENWQSRLRGLEQYLCELLIENQRLRMSLTPVGVDPLAETAK